MALRSSSAQKQHLEGWHVLGIDLAPAKGLHVFGEDQIREVAAKEAREFIAKEVENHERLLIAWDAPLSFDFELSLSDRPVDKVLRKFTADRVPQYSGPGKAAISVQCFSQCPHWSLTCFALGLPFGTRPGGLRLAPEELSEDATGAFVIEVHPAVTLGLWWLEKGLRDRMPRYKGAPEICRIIADRMGAPKEAAQTDDHLDAWVACRMAEDFLAGNARWIGNPEIGGYVLPTSAQERWGLHDAVLEKVSAMR